MKRNLYRKTLVFVVIGLFIGAGVIPVIRGNFEKNVRNNNEIEVAASNLDTEIFYPTDDARIRMKDPDNNYGDLEWLDIRNRYGYSGHPYYWEHDTLIMFNLLSIPKESEIISAILYLYYYDYWDSNPSGRSLTLHKVTSEWNETTVTWNTQPNFLSEVISSTVVPNSPNNWIEWNVTSDVQNIANGESNNGWIIMDEVPWGNYNIPNTKFRSKEYGDYIPYLEIEINDGSNQPPTANFMFKPKEATALTVLNFFDRSEDKDGTIVDWWWDFGDNYYSDLQNPVHCYYIDGGYVVSLTVTDDDGATDTVQKTIEIQ